MAEYISYALSGAATLLGLIEPFNKKMSIILFFSLVGNLLVAASYAFAGTEAMTGALICAVACVELIINFLLKKKEKKIPAWLLVIYSLAFVGVNLIGGINAWFDILALLAALCFVFSYAQQNSKYYRVLFVVNSGLWIVYDICAVSYGNLFTHIALFIATIISITIHERKKKSNV